MAFDLDEDRVNRSEFSGAWGEPLSRRASFLIIAMCSAIGWGLIIVVIGALL